MGGNPIGGPGGRAAAKAWEEVVPSPCDFTTGGGFVITDNGNHANFRLVGGGKHEDRKSTRLNSSHSQNSYAVFCLKKKNNERLDTSKPSPAIAHSTFGVAQATRAILRP